MNIIWTGDSRDLSRLVRASPHHFYIYAQIPNVKFDRLYVMPVPINYKEISAQESQQRYAH
jgi:hypothetical protein